MVRQEVELQSGCRALLISRPLLPAWDLMGNRVNSSARRRRALYHQQSAVETPASAPAGRRGSPPRQVSADSGIEADLAGDVLELAARPTSAQESESFLLTQPCYNQQFLPRLARLLEPLQAELVELAFRPDLTPHHLAGLPPRLRVLCTDAAVAFPRSLAASARSPRYQERLQLAVENAALHILQVCSAV